MAEDAKEKWLQPDVMREEAEQEEGVYGRYKQSAESGDFSHVAHDALTDDAYARLYAANLRTHLQRNGLPTSGRILDVGCAFGHITNAIHTVFGAESEVHGIELGRAAVDVAKERYPDCHFIAGSGEDLEAYEDGSFDLIHARGLYSFTRTDDVELHLHFLRKFASKLKPGGAVIAVQINYEKGLQNTFDAMRSEAASLGFTRLQRKVFAPYRLYRRFGDMLHAAPIYPFMAVAGYLMEAVSPGRVSYSFVFAKS